MVMSLYFYSVLTLEAIRITNILRNICPFSDIGDMQFSLLQSNNVSHWLGANLESAPILYHRYLSVFVGVRIRCLWLFIECDI